MRTTSPSFVTLADFMLLARVKLVVVSLNKLESKQESATFKFKLPESLIVMSELAVMRLK